MLQFVNVVKSEVNLYCFVVSRNNQDCNLEDETQCISYKTKMLNRENWSTERSGNSCRLSNKNRTDQLSSGAFENGFLTKDKNNQRSLLCKDLFIYEWRKKCLYSLLLGLIVMVILNLSLTMWLFNVMEFSSEGIGAMRIMKRGVELRGQAAVLDNLIASTISSRNGRNLMLESWSNFTATTRAANGHISARLTLNEKQVDLITKSFEIASLDGETLFSADREQVVVGATLLKVTGVGGATFHGSLETSLVRSESGLGLRLESSTRALEVRASERVVVESRAGEILTNSLLDLTLQSVEGAVKLDAKIIILKGLTIQIKFTHDDQRQHYQSIPKNRSITNEEKLSVYQLCACANGKLFLARPDGICQADNTICY
ncbi:zeta-sarcoglycan-like isoform X2 [Aphidius gifuensis]|uniref:zeta-sarcoglycan-like isoform X2 n=1 Tax=Aphidius gifuensis TaxID=684658 RepID=UPI001CDBE127|nr:zeta-sarcoglycan-like isoform X2 [Aphidius gifuensis]